MLCLPKDSSLVSQANSWSRLKISMNMFCMLAQYYSSSPALLDLTAGLGFKVSDTEESCANMYYRLHAPDDNHKSKSYGMFDPSKQQVCNTVQKSRIAYDILNSIVGTSFWTLGVLDMQWFISAACFPRIPQPGLSLRYRPLFVDSWSAPFPRQGSVADRLLWRLLILWLCIHYSLSVVKGIGMLILNTCLSSTLKW